MSDLLCVPFRPGWQVGISERRNGFTKNIASCDFFLAGLRRLVLRFASCEAVSGEPGSAKVEETRRMSDLLCAPFRPRWQVGISERRNLCRPGGV